MTTLGQALSDAERRFAAAGIESARADSRILVGHAAGLDRAQVLTRSDAPLSSRAAARLACMTERRAAREPVALITGTREFWSLPFKVTRATLVPRPDSETLIEAALAALPDRTQPYRVLDLGTGSGCLLLALLSELPNATGVGVDASRAAVRVARTNAQRLKIAERASFVAGDWGGALDERYDVILANPPYVCDTDWAALDDDVKLYEPKTALLGGADGLDAYRALAPDVRKLLAPNGIFVGEIGAGQAAGAARILAQVGLTVRATACDLSGISRCLLATSGGNDGSAKLKI
jgi:release factor glutamine methyltransferase